MNVHNPFHDLRPRGASRSKLKQGAALYFKTLSQYTFKTSRS